MCEILKTKTNLLRVGIKWDINLLNLTVYNLFYSPVGVLGKSHLFFPGYMIYTVSRDLWFSAFVKNISKLIKLIRKPTWFDLRYWLLYNGVYLLQNLRVVSNHQIILIIFFISIMYKYKLILLFFFCNQLKLERISSYKFNS